MSGLLSKMFYRLKRHGHTKEVAAAAAAMATQATEYAGWDHDRKNWSAARIVATGVLGLFAGETLMRARTEKSSELNRDALAELIHDSLLKHRNDAARESAISFSERAYEELRAWLYNPGASMNPIHDQCVHKFARYLLENSENPLKELANEILPKLENWCRDALARWDKTTT